MKNFDDVVTPEYLLDWTEKYEEDPIVDGPFYLSKEQAEEFTEMLSDRTKDILAEYYCEPFAVIWKQDIGLALDDDEAEDDILKCFCHIVNKYNIKEY